MLALIEGDMCFTTVAQHHLKDPVQNSSEYFSISTKTHIDQSGSSWQAKKWTLASSLCTSPLFLTCKTPSSSMLFLLDYAHVLLCFSFCMVRANQSPLPLLSCFSYWALTSPVCRPLGDNLSFNVQNGLSPGNKGRGEVRRGEEKRVTAEECRRSQGGGFQNIPLFTQWPYSYIRSHFFMSVHAFCFICAPSHTCTHTQSCAKVAVSNYCVSKMLNPGWQEHMVPFRARMLH